MTWRTIVVYLIVGLIFAAIGLVWWQTMVCIFTVCIAEAILIPWEGHKLERRK